jgi:hypothetical protein
MKLVRLIKMGLMETYSRVWVDKHLPNMLRSKKGLLPLIFHSESMPLRWFMWTKLEIKWYKLASSYADYINILGEIL